MSPSFKPTLKVLGFLNWCGGAVIIGRIRCLHMAAEPPSRACRELFALEDSRLPICCSLAPARAGLALAPDFAPVKAPRGTNDIEWGKTSLHLHRAPTIHVGRCYYSLRPCLYTTLRLSANRSCSAQQFSLWRSHRGSAPETIRLSM